MTMTPNEAPKPAETLQEYGDRIAAAARNRFMSEADDDIIGMLDETYMVFGRACAILAIETAMLAMTGDGETP